MSPAAAYAATVRRRSVVSRPRRGGSSRMPSEQAIRMPMCDCSRHALRHDGQLRGRGVPLLPPPVASVDLWSRWRRRVSLCGVQPALFEGVATTTMSCSPGQCRCHPLPLPFTPRPPGVHCYTLSEVIATATPDAAPVRFRLRLSARDLVRSISRPSEGGGRLIVSVPAEATVFPNGL